jgi:hypothetical protein
MQETIQKKVESIIKQRADDLYTLVKADAKWLEDNKIQLKFNLPIGTVRPIIPGSEQKWFGAEVYILCKPKMHHNQNTITVQHKDGIVGYFSEQEVLLTLETKEVEVDNYQVLSNLHHKVNLHSFTLQERLKKLAKQNVTVWNHSTSANFYSFSSWSDRFRYVLNHLVVPNIEVVDSWEIEILKQLKLVEALETALY